MSEDENESAIVDWMKRQGFQTREVEIAGHKVMVSSPVGEEPDLELIADDIAAAARVKAAQKAFYDDPAIERAFRDIAYATALFNLRMGQECTWPIPEELMAEERARAEKVWRKENGD